MWWVEHQFNSDCQCGRKKNELSQKYFDFHRNCSCCEFHWRISLNYFKNFISQSVALAFPTEDYADIDECVTSRKIIQPKELTNVMNEKRLLIQNETFVQSIVVETCEWVIFLTKFKKQTIFKATFIRSGTPCKSSSLGDLRTSCVQEYMKMSLVASQENGEVVNESFYLPSHCVCQLIKNKSANTTKTNELAQH